MYQSSSLLFNHQLSLRNTLIKGTWTYFIKFFQFLFMFPFQLIPWVNVFRIICHLGNNKDLITLVFLFLFLFFSFFFSSYLFFFLKQGCHYTLWHFPRVFKYNSKEKIYSYILEFHHQIWIIYICSSLIPPEFLTIPLFILELVSVAPSNDFPRNINW